MRRTNTTAIPSTLDGKLRHYRVNAGLSAEHVAIHVGRTAGAVRDWELNRRPPRDVLLVQLARLYGVSVTELTSTEHLPNEYPQ